MNCHIFDGKLKHLSHRTKFNIDYETKMKLFSKVAKELEGNRKALRCFDIIWTDTGKKSNYDCTNDLMADDLLYLICLKIDKDMMPMFIEQLADMNSGLCSQGRCIRLAQIYQCIYDIPDNSDVDNTDNDNVLSNNQICKDLFYGIFDIACDRLKLPS